ncbi:TetR/AcrR family transcriptional regulator [Streptomyces sp. NPDC001415]
MAGRRASRDAITREQWAERIAAAASADAESATGSGEGARGHRRSRTPISVERIVAAALDAIEIGGFDDLTMRTVAAALDTGPASLYAHVRNKAELGDLLIGELCSRVELPTPDAGRWQEQFLDLCAQLRDQFLRYPGVARAALAAVPAELASLRLGEAMLTLLLLGGASARDAAWTSDAAFLYVTAYCLEAAIVQRQSQDLEGASIDRAEIVERLRMLPAQQFPNTVAHAKELTAGAGHDRFDFALSLMLRGLT